MPKKWKTIRIFISSTFRDMHAERDHLIRFVFPELKEKCRKHRVHLIDVDLRWGVTEADAQDGKALDICLDEIDTCRPYFLGFLGHLYGSIPPGETHSITAQEIFHGVLHNDIPKQVVDLRRIIEGKFEGKALANEQINCLVRCYQWNAYKGKYLLRKDVEDDELKIIRTVFEQYSAYQRNRSFFFFRSDSLTHKLAGKKVDDFFEKEKLNQDKLADVKQEIIDVGLPWFEYDEIEALGEKVERVLWERIETEIGELTEKEKDWLVEEAEFHELFVADRTRRFVGRRKLLDRIHGFCEKVGEPSVMLITGEPGCGKSALMGKFTTEVLHNLPDWLILPHFIGASPNSTSLRQTLKRLCKYIHKQLNIDDEIPEDIEELKQIFPDLLSKVAEHRRILIILDAVNQFEKADNAHNVQWLPQKLPDNVRIVVSTLAGEAHDALMVRRDKPEIAQVGGLDEKEIKKLVHDYLKEISKDFPNEDDEKAFYDKVRLGNPLYILVALEEMRVFGEFYKLADRIKQLPDTVPDLFDQVLERIEDDFSKSLLRDCMAFIACGRQGMTAEELQALLSAHAPQQDAMALAEKLPDMIWARLYRAFGPYLFDRSGVIDFFHGQLKEAVGNRYLNNEQDRIGYHNVLADYYETRWNEPYNKALDELPHQKLKAKDWQGVKLILTNFIFLKSKLDIIGLYPLIDDFKQFLDKITEEDASQCETESIEKILYALNLSCHAIAVDKAQLPGQLLGRLQCFSDLDIRSLLDQAAQWKSETWLRPMTLSLQAPDGPLLRTILTRTDTIKAFSMSHDGRRLVAVTENEALVVWDLNLGIELGRAKAHNNRMTAVSIAYDGSLAITLSENNAISLWNLKTQEEVKIFPIEYFPVDFLDASSDFRYAVSASKKGEISVWDLTKGKRTNRLYANDSEDVGSIYKNSLFDNIHAIAITSNGQEVITISNRKWRPFVKSDAHFTVIDIWSNKDGSHKWFYEMNFSSAEICAITPDGHFAAISYGNTICIWDLSLGHKLHNINEHPDKISTMTFLSDGRRLAISTTAGVITIYNIALGMKEKSFDGPGETVHAITHDCNLAISIQKSNIIKVWNHEQWFESFTLEGHIEPINSVAISSDGNSVVSVSDDGVIIGWDLERRCEQNIIEGHRKNIDNIVTTHDLKTAVSFYSKEREEENYDLSIWDLRRFVVLNDLSGHTKPIKKVVLTKDGKKALSTSADRSIRLWDVQLGKCILVCYCVNYRPNCYGSSKNFLLVDDNHYHRLKRDPNSEIVKITVGSMVLTQDGKKAVFAVKFGGDAALLIYDFKFGGTRVLWKSYINDVGGWPPATNQSVEISSDGKYLYGLISIQDRWWLRKWDLSVIINETYSPSALPIGFTRGETSGITGGKQVSSISGTGSPNGLKISNDGNRAFLSGDNCLDIMDVEKGINKIYSSTAIKSNINSISVSDNNRRIAIADSSKWELELYFIKPWLDQYFSRQLTNKILFLSSTQDPNCVVSVSNEGILNLWNTKTGTDLNTMDIKMYEGVEVISSRGRYRISVSDKGEINKLELSESDPLNILAGLTMYGPTGSVIANSPDKKRLIWLSNCRIKVIDIKSGEFISVSGYSNKQVTSFALASYDGLIVVLGLLSGDLEIVNLRNGRNLHTLHGHIDRVNAIVVDDFRQKAISVSDDATVRVWDLKNREPLNVFSGGGSTKSVAITKDGKKAVSASANGIAKIWNLISGELIATWSADEKLTACAITHDSKNIVLGEETGNMHFLSLKE